MPKVSGSAPRARRVAARAPSSFSADMSATHPSKPGGETWMLLFATKRHSGSVQREISTGHLCVENHRRLRQLLPHRSGDSGRSVPVCNRQHPGVPQLSGRRDNALCPGIYTIGAGSTTAVYSVLLNGQPILNALSIWPSYNSGTSLLLTQPGRYTMIASAQGNTPALLAKYYAYGDFRWPIQHLSGIPGHCGTGSRGEDGH